MTRTKGPLVLGDMSMLIMCSKYKVFTYDNNLAYLSN
jgi:hypothetical protein